MTTTTTVSAKTVVVADDTAFVRDRFKAALEGAGHKALPVRSAAELLLRVRADLARIDLLVLDLRLPNANGVEMVRAIRKIDGGKLPILVFSGTIASAEEVRELAALGVAGYLNEYIAVEHIMPSMAPHLFPESFNRRGNPRVVMGIPVSYRVGKTIAAALALNLSSGGVAIRTSKPLVRGTVMKLRFALPGAKKEIETEAIVCWSDQKAGMGVQFTKVRQADQSMISTFVEAHFFRSIKLES